jgi:hypothetical protein
MTLSASSNAVKSGVSASCPSSNTIAATNTAPANAAHFSAFAVPGGE